MKITILNENVTYKRGLLCEHGLSLLIEQEGKRWLFDTGQTEVFIRNAKRLGVSLKNLDGIILSHGHYDHCGGLKTLLREKGRQLPPVYVRKEAFDGKYADKGGEKKEEIGIPWERSECPNLRLLTEAKTEIAKGVWLLGRIPYTEGLESFSPGMFVLRQGAFEADPMADEQMLVFETERGLCVFAGCSHPGILNCLHYVRDCFPGKKIYSLLAGMHLMHAGQERIQWTVDHLSAWEIEVLMPVHCTGIRAISRIREAFPGQYRKAECGDVIEI